MTIVYADELFLLNGCIDYLLLLCTARLFAFPLRRGRLALSAALGGVYAVLAVLPATRFLAGTVGKLVSAAVLACLAFGRAVPFGKSTLAFLSLSAGFAGAVYAAALLAGQDASRGIAVHLSLRVLLLSFGAAYALLRFCFRCVPKARARRFVTAEVTLGGKTSSFRVLLDSGNALTAPTDGLPVLVADPAALAPVLPMSGALPLGDAAALFRSLSETELLHRRVRLIPYTAVGCSGMLVCFRPDALRIDGEGSGALVAISPTAVGDAEYQGVL